MQSIAPYLRYLSRALLCGGTALAFTFVFAFFFVTASPFTHAAADDDIVVSVEPAELLTPAQLRELVAPIALYSDELLAIVLPASTYPLQVVAAARYREAVVADPSLEPDEYWDESIVALLNYPEALAFLNADLDWTWSLGQAVTDQQADLLAAVSAYRDEAYAAGNLESDDKHVVAVEDEAVTITSADPEVIHVPYYDPEQVTIYQTERVYHYYPTAYPVYFYPYTSWHRFYDHGFWGINSAFVLSWSRFYLGHHLHSHHYHPYYGRRYHPHHYRYTNRYLKSPSYKRRHKYRREHRRDHYRWQPDRRWYGDRPHRARHHAASKLPRDRHLYRNPPRVWRGSVHRDWRREIDSVSQPPTRSSVHLPSGQVRTKPFQAFKPQGHAQSKRHEHRDKGARHERPKRQERQARQDRHTRQERHARSEGHTRLERQTHQARHTQPARQDSHTRQARPAQHRRQLDKSAKFQTAKHRTRQTSEVRVASNQRTAPSKLRARAQRQFPQQRPPRASTRQAGARFRINQ